MGIIYGPNAAGGNAIFGPQAGSPSGAGTFRSEPLTMNNGEILRNMALKHMTLYNETSGALVIRRTGLSTDDDGVVEFSDAALTIGSIYKADWETVQGHRRMPKTQAL